MSAAAAGWGMAALAGAVAGLLARRLDRRARCLARACHEVRGPLTAARLGLELAGAGEGPLLAVERELRRATRLLDELQGVRRPVSAGLVDLRALARDAAPLAGAEITVAMPRAPVLVEGDEGRLAQVLRNLLANAAEHGAAPVRLEVRTVRGRALLAVEDSGPGLPAPLDALTARASRARRGHGLAVAAAIAAEHGGRLAPAPSARGARLVLDLPVAPAGAAAAGARP
jgi:signal transduction histidine kinase